MDWIQSAAWEAFRDDMYQLSRSIETVQNDFQQVAREMMRPSTIYKPELTQDGNAWLAILGDLPTGVVGCGDSPHEAMLDFDRAFCEKAKTPSNVAKEAHHG